MVKVGYVVEINPQHAENMLLLFVVMFCDVVAGESQLLRVAVRVGERERERVDKQRGVDYKSYTCALLNA